MTNGDGAPFEADTPDAPGALMAVLLTDVVDSTRLYEQVGDAQARALWTEHDQRARALLQAWRGREIGRSDGFLLLFPTADEALAYAAAYLQALAHLTPPFAARVGLHWGPVSLRQNTARDVAAGATPFEVDGLALPTAARVMAAARGGQILLSQPAAQTLSSTFLKSWQLCNHGHWRMKGLQQPMELIEVGELGSALLAPADSAKAYRVVHRNGLWIPVAELPHNLGVEPDYFVGRDDTLYSLALAFDDTTRLVTLLGIGGIGKTRLARRYARGWLGGFLGGAWFCDLASATGLDGIVLAVAEALHVPLGRTDPVLQLGGALAARGDCLVVLDNFEQVVGCARETLSVWLDAAPQARFLVTSREVLGLGGETLLRLEPLTTTEAQALFTQRMQAAGLGGQLEPADADALPTLVELLDRLPLAIELAAARALVMPPAEQVQRMGQRFALLAGPGNRLSRQATLRAALDWSWDLLTPAEQAALAQLSVFEGGFTLAACEAVLEWPAGTAAPYAADVLQSLVQKSLVRRLHARRFDLLRTVQDYAAQQLAERLVDGVQNGGQDISSPSPVQRHCRYYADRTEAQAISERGVEIDNLAAACRRAARLASVAPMGTAQRRRADEWAIGALVNAWAVLRLKGPFRAALDLARPLEGRPDLALHLQARLARVRGAAAGLMGNADEAYAHYQRGLALAHAAADQPLAVQLRCLMADLDVLGGRIDAAQTALTDLAAAAGPDVMGGMSELMWVNAQANLAHAQSDPPRAEAHYRRALALAQSLGDRRWQGGLYSSIGMVALTQGRLQQAREHLQEGLRLADDIGDRQWAGSAHCNLGLLLHELGEPARACAELTAALQLSLDMGHRRLQATTLCNLGLVATALQQPDDALQYLRRAVAAAQALHAPKMEGPYRGYLGALLGSVGQLAEALEQLDTAQRLLEGTGDTQAIALLACQRVVVVVQQGDLTAAADGLRRAEGLLARLSSPSAELTLALRGARQIVNQAVNPRC